MALLSPPCALPFCLGPGSPILQPPSAKSSSLRLFFNPKETWEWRAGKGALEQERPASPSVSGGSFLGGLSGGWILTRRGLLIQQVFIDLTVCSLWIQESKTGIPALGEFPVQLTDAHALGLTLEAHRGTQTQTHSQPHPDTPPDPLRETQTPARATGALRDPRDLGTQDYDYKC